MPATWEPLAARITQTRAQVHVLPTLPRGRHRGELDLLLLAKCPVSLEKNLQSFLHGGPQMVALYMTFPQVVISIAHWLKSKQLGGTAPYPAARHRAACLVAASCGVVTSQATRPNRLDRPLIAVQW